MSKLQGLRILVTRPTDQAPPLMAALQQEGAKPWHFPLLEIVPYAAPELPQRIAQLGQYDIAIFISNNAVEYGLAALAGQALPPQLKLATIGKGTAQALENKLQRKADIFPTSGFDSEALLSLPELNGIEGKRILIFRGQGGREKLASTLRERGAQVDYAEVYSRQRPEPDCSELLTAIQSHTIDLILITSSEALNNLLVLVPEKYHTDLQLIPVLTVHPRQARHAGEQGFKQALIASSASHSDIIDCLKQHFI